jgi:hypothetical protein
MTKTGIAIASLMTALVLTPTARAQETIDLAKITCDQYHTCFSRLPIRKTSLYGSAAAIMERRGGLRSSMCKRCETLRAR